MIRPLRRQHRILFVLLAVALIALFIAGLSVRTVPSPPNHLRLPLPENSR